MANRHMAHINWLLYICIGLLCGVSQLHAQRYDYVYKQLTDSSHHCYVVVIPANEPIRGLVIRDYSTLPDLRVNKLSAFASMCAEAGLVTVYTVSSPQFPELFVADSAMDILDDMVAEVKAAYHIPAENIFMGGISASGTRALRYAQYCALGKSKHGIRIKGVFVVDAPLDLARFYTSVYANAAHFKEGMLWEATLMQKVFGQWFGGSPQAFPATYRSASVFTHGDSMGGNAYALKEVSLLLFHEPDIDWWLEARGAGYFDINSYDIVAFVLQMRMLGNRHVELVTTTQKGFDKNGQRNCHSWSIVDEVYLVRWLCEQLS